jgi:hypothetical protein
VQHPFGPAVVELAAVHYPDLFFPVVRAPKLCPHSQYLTLARHLDP